MISPYSKILPLLFLFSTSFSRVHPFAPITSKSKVHRDSTQKVPTSSSSSQVSIHPFQTGSKQRHLHETATSAKNSSTRTSASIQKDGLHPSLHTTSLSQNVLKLLIKAGPIFISLALVKGLTSSLLRRSVNTFFLKHPYIAAFAICAFKASLADFLVQKNTNNDLRKSVNGSTNTNFNKMVNGGAIVQNPFEFKRNLAFFFYGGAYQGCIQEHIFNHIYPALFGSGTDLATVSVKVIFDMFFTSPLICLPVAYIIKGGIYNHSVLHSIKRYIHDIKVNKLMTKNWIGKYNVLAIILYCTSFSTVYE